MQLALVTKVVRRISWYSSLRRFLSIERPSRRNRIGTKAAATCVVL